MRCFEAEALSGSMVEVMHGDRDVLFGNGIEAHFLWEEFADEAVHVLVGAPFPGRIGVSEEKISIEFLGDSLVLGELSAVVCRQRMDASRKRRQQGNQGVRDGLRGLERDVGEQRVARRTLVHCDEGLLLSGANDQVRLPVTETLAATDDRWTFVDRDLVGNRAASITTSIALLAELLAAQGTVQGATGAFVRVDTLVDGFVADGGLPVGLEVARDLLWTPGLGKLGLDQDHVSAQMRGPFSHASSRA